MRDDWIVTIAFVALFIGIVIGSVFVYKPTVITIYKSYQSNNTTFKSLEPVYQIPLKKGTFTWEDWVIEIK
jgi:hypothetical protein